MLRKIFYSLPLFLFLSCSTGLQKINIGHDQCSFCKMTIMSENFACQTITPKGKVYNYDDLKCQMTAFKNESEKLKESTMFVGNFLNGGEYIEHSKAIFVKANAFKSPMAGNIAAVKSQSEAEKLAKEKDGVIVEISNAFD